MTSKIISWPNLPIKIKVVHNPKQKNLIYRFKPGLLYISSPRPIYQKDIMVALDKYSAQISKYCFVETLVPTLHLWGKAYQLELVKAKYNQIILEPQKIIVYYDNKEPKKLIKEFYNEELSLKYKAYYEEIKGRVNRLYNKNVLVTFKGIGYYKSFLGRCFWQKNQIELSGYLAKYPEEEIKGVIAHEFAHLFVHNHSQAFKEVLAQIDASYKQHISNIKKYNRDIRNDYI